MLQGIGFQDALEGFLRSETFETIVRAGLAQLPDVPHVVALYRDGPFTVYSTRAEVHAAPDMLLMTIPGGDEHSVRAEMRQLLARPHAPLSLHS